MSGDGGGEEVITAIVRYLKSIKGIGRFVVALEGLPLHWSDGMTQEEAEELAALATDAVYSVGKFKGIVDPRRLIVDVTSGGRNISMLAQGDLTVVTEGVPGITEAALSNVLKKGSGDGVKCPACSADLSLTPVKCPSCGAPIPYGVRTCPQCGSTVKYVLCPKCSSMISPSGRRMVYRRNRSYVKLGAALIGIAGGISAALVVFGGAGMAWLAAAVAGALVVTAGALMSSRELVEV